MERHTCRPDVSPLKQMIMKRVKHLLLASCLLPTFLGAQGVASASFLEITPDAQSAGMAGTGLAITDNGSTAIFHNASTIAFSQDVMGASYSYADINKDFGMHSASLFYRIGREGKHGFSVGFRHYKDADFHWQDGAEDHARAWNVEAAYFRNVAKNLSLSLTLRYLQAKAYKDADSKGSVSVDLGASYHRSMGILDKWLHGQSDFKPPTWVASWTDRNCLPDWDWVVPSTCRSVWTTACRWLLTSITCSRPSTAIFKLASERNIIS